jgi:type I restriction enzyme R subunit
LTGKNITKNQCSFPLSPAGCCAETNCGCKAKRSGQRYLIEHSAGSGKSNSIAWLAYRLSSLYDVFDKKIFDSVIVITDRNVLDQQLQNTIYQFEHKSGVVQRIDADSRQLADAITNGVSIIITTCRNFRLP